MTNHATTPINLLAAREPAFIEQVERESGQNLTSCYQCGNCTAGCPVGPYAETPVGAVMRAVQAGLAERALASSAIWLCVGCSTCTTRCPNDIDVARVMDVLRHEALARGMVAEPLVRTFAEAFLAAAGRTGRLFEPEVLIRYGLKTGRVTTDADLLPKLIAAGKNPLIPHKGSVAGREAVSAIFRRFLDLREREKAQRVVREAAPK